MNMNINQARKDNVILQVDSRVSFRHVCRLAYFENLAFIDGDAAVHD
jgi:hypothetical protein